MGGSGAEAAMDEMHAIEAVGYATPLHRDRWYLVPSRWTWALLVVTLLAAAWFWCVPQPWVFVASVPGTGIGGDFDFSGDGKRVLLVSLGGDVEVRDARNGR